MSSVLQIHLGNLDDPELQKWLEWHGPYVVIPDYTLDRFKTLSTLAQNFEMVYLCGNLNMIYDSFDYSSYCCVIKDKSYGFSHVDIEQVHSSKVPKNYGIGDMYPDLFKDEPGLFDEIQQAHQFQNLTETNKPGTAHRTGIYLSEVRKSEDGYKYGLMRCSTNFQGPTENLKGVDLAILDKVNSLDCTPFIPVDHVLAQIYHNNPAQPGQKETRAKIKSHSDKTKDMNANGFIAFCTFYDKSLTTKLKPSQGEDMYDWQHKNISGLTELVFRSKEDVGKPPIHVKLYPGSVFVIGLYTNQYYTHEIRPPAGLDISHIPTRMGYVCRSSDVSAVYKDGETRIGTPGRPLRQPTKEDYAQIKDLYAKENLTTESNIYCGFNMDFSLNQGDYMQPTYSPTDRLRTRTIQTPSFEQWMAEAESGLETITAGRRAAIFVSQMVNKVPIVRSSTKYTNPPYFFTDSMTKTFPDYVNNIMFEVYDKQYKTMRMHSDLDIDLDSDYEIQIVSLYEHPEQDDGTRVLVVQDKRNGETAEIPLSHGTVTSFSVESNALLRHQIVHRAKPNETDNGRWLGMTLRVSNSFYDPCFKSVNSRKLKLDKTGEIYKLCKEQREDCSPLQTRCDFTVNEADFKPPVKLLQ